MEEKKFDVNSIIGFILIFAILIFMMWQNQPTPEELAEQERLEKIEADKKEDTIAVETTKVVTSDDFTAPQAGDSLKLEALKNKLGAFTYASTLPSATDTQTTVQTDVLDLKFSNKG